MIETTRTFKVISLSEAKIRNFADAAFVRAYEQFDLKGLSLEPVGAEDFRKALELLIDADHTFGSALLGAEQVLLQYSSEESEYQYTVKFIPPELMSEAVTYLSSKSYLVEPYGKYTSHYDMVRLSPTEFVSGIARFEGAQVKMLRSLVWGVKVRGAPLRRVKQD